MPFKSDSFCTLLPGFCSDLLSVQKSLLMYVLSRLDISAVALHQQISKGMEPLINGSIIIIIMIIIIILIRDAQYYLHFISIDRYWL